jgi:transcriptional regulator with XRE-family HTH domain
MSSPQVLTSRSVSTESAAPTGISSLKAVEPTHTDAEWPTWHGRRIAVDSTFQAQGTPLYLPPLHSGSFAPRIQASAVANLTMVIVVGQELLGATATAAEEVTAAASVQNDWAVIVPRLLEHHLPEHRWLCQRTSRTIGEWVPTVGFEVARPQGGRAETHEVPAAARSGIGAGRALHPGLRAVDDLRRWLTLTIADLARITGVSESTIYWWAEHPTSIPRPAKIDRLLGLQALVGAMIDDLGQTITDRWFRSGQPSRLDRLRNDPEALAAIEKEGYDLLMHRARKRLAAAGPARPVTDDDDRRDLARLAEQEREYQEPLKVEAFDPDRLEPDDLP